MTIPLSDRVAPGTVIRLTDEQRAMFPYGTVITRDTQDVFTASVPVSKQGERDRVAHVSGAWSIDALAVKVEEHFPRPPSPELP